MLNNLSTIGISKIIKCIQKLDLDIILTTPQLKHVVTFISAMVFKGHNGKVSDVSDLTSPPYKEEYTHPIFVLSGYF